MGPCQGLSGTSWVGLRSFPRSPPRAAGAPWRSYRKFFENSFTFLFAAAIKNLKEPSRATFRVFVGSAGSHRSRPMKISEMGRRRTSVALHTCREAKKRQVPGNLHASYQYPPSAQRRGGSFHFVDTLQHRGAQGISILWGHFSTWVLKKCPLSTEALNKFPR